MRERKMGKESKCKRKLPVWRKANIAGRIEHAGSCT